MGRGKYDVRHIRCTMKDFRADVHRFSFSYNGRKHTAECYHGAGVYFNDSVPDYVQTAVIRAIWNLIDEKEYTWKYPKEAYDIADEYCGECFAVA